MNISTIKIALKMGCEVRLTKEQSKQLFEHIEQLQARVVGLEKERAERDAEVARRAFIDGAIWHVGLSIHDDRPHGENAFKKPANEYAERIKRGEI